MLSLKRMFLGVSMLLIALIVVACGSNSSTTTGGSGGTTPTTAPTTSAAIIKTATATVNGSSVTILTNAQGMTLYYFKPDTATNAACTGTCAGNWPPLLFTGTGSPTSATSLTGTLSAVTNANGQQVEYNGHPLYRFSGDTAPGQTNGEGIAGKWYVVTSDLATQSAPQGTPTPTPTTSGYGY
jgi:predicted lipoprotein with Yx(FWY)xxD motif